MERESTVRIGLTGDVMIGRLVNSFINFNYHYPWGDTLNLIRSNDINIINLETTLTNSDHAATKTFVFKASPDKVDVLSKAKITLVNLANNHILDFHIEGLIDTLTILDHHGVKHVGAGRNVREAEQAEVITRKDVRIGVLGFTDNESSWRARTQPGTHYIDITNPEDTAAALNKIKFLHNRTDLVIVSVHWGPNMVVKPPSHFIDFAHAMIDHGASIIHGHSAHVLQGIEVYHDKLILYDTGDFIDDYAVDPFLRNDQSALFVVTVEQKEIVSLQIIPVIISRCQVNLATGNDFNRIIHRLQHLSEAWGTIIEDDGFIHWRTHAHHSLPTDNNH